MPVWPVLLYHEKRIFFTGFIPVTGYKWGVWRREYTSGTDNYPFFCRNGECYISRPEVYPER